MKTSCLPRLDRFTTTLPSFLSMRPFITCNISKPCASASLSLSQNLQLHFLLFSPLSLKTFFFSSLLPPNPLFLSFLPKTFLYFSSSSFSPHPKPSPSLCSLFLLLSPQTVFSYCLSSFSLLTQSLLLLLNHWL